MKIFSFRLRQGQDLKSFIEKFVVDNNIKAGVVLSAVGSLKTAVLRMAEEEIKTFDQKFEIVSLTGTLSMDGCHLHISLSDDNGTVIGGHMKEGCIIHTTAEVVLGEIENEVFNRIYDENTGFKELEF